MPVDITPEVDDFRNAVYGEEVRGSMISLAEKLAESADNSETVANQATTDVAQGLASITDTADRAEAATTAANEAASSANDAAAAANSATDAANSAESSRASAEQARVSAEQARANAESARVTAEQARASAENQRVTAETARAGSETNRQDAEGARREAETARASAEQGRVSAESARVAAETGRANAETSRASAESNRNSTFASMQRSFADMVEQVMPPATTSTLGGVIVGEGLNVASDGTLSFEAGDFLTKAEASETYATTTELEGKADAIHFHNASDITDGTLAVARGGTGVSTAAAERERLGLGSTTGALPVANGGTGASNATDARTNLSVYSKAEVDAEIADIESSYLPLAGGTLSGALVESGGDITVHSQTIDRDGATPSTSIFGNRYRLEDKDKDAIGYIDGYTLNTGEIGLRMVALAGSSSSVVTNVLRVGKKADGTNVYYVTDPAAFREAINAVGADNQASQNATFSTLNGTAQHWALRSNVINSNNATYYGHNTGIVVGNTYASLFDFTAQGSIWTAYTTQNPQPADAWDVYKSTTVSQVISAASGITVSSVAYAEWGKVAQLSVAFTGMAASTGYQTVGTVVSGKRPVYNVYATDVSTSYAVYAQLTTAGALTVYWGTAPGTSTSYTACFVYILA